MKLVDEVKDLSERKGLAYIKGYIKFLKDDAEDVIIKHKESVEYRATSITIDVTKHFDDKKFTLDKLTDTHKIEIKMLIDKIFEYIKNNYLDSNDENVKPSAYESNQDITTKQIDVAKQQESTVED